MTTKTRRTTEEIVAELQAKIVAVEAAGARRKARANPATKHGTAALKLIDKAAGATADVTARKALEEARGSLSAWLAVEGAHRRPGRDGAGEEAQEEEAGVGA